MPKRAWSDNIGIFGRANSRKTRPTYEWQPAVRRKSGADEISSRLSSYHQARSDRRAKGADLGIALAYQGRFLRSDRRICSSGAGRLCRASSEPVSREK